MRELIEAMKKAYASLSNGEADVPLRTRLPIPAHNGLSLFMPAYVGGDSEALAVKIVSLFPGNPQRGLAYIQAAVLVFEPKTGQATALLEGSTLTALRTGAGSGAAIDLLARKDSKTAAIFGAGIQGRAQLEAACTVRQIEKAWVYDPDMERASIFTKELAGRGRIPHDLQPASTSQEAVRDADIVCTATTSRMPVFADADIKSGAHISAIGSYTPDMVEVPPDTIRRARLFVDSCSAVLAETGDLIHPITNGQVLKSQIAELGEVLLGRKPGRETESEITYFKSVGVAVQDAIAAQLAVMNARKLGLGLDISF